MKYARIVSNTAFDVRTESPDGFFHPEVAAQFITVPDQVEDGWLLKDEVWSVPPAPVAPVPVVAIPPKVGPLEFQMLFTIQEKVAIEDSTDRAVRRFMKLVDDPRLLVVDLSLKSISDALDYMTGINLLAAGRKAQILTGTPR